MSAIWHYFTRLRTGRAFRGGWGPAKVLEIDESGVTVSFQSQNFEVARYCVRRRMKDSEVPEVEGPGERPGD